MFVFNITHTPGCLLLVQTTHICWYYTWSYHNYVSLTLRYPALPPRLLSGSVNFFFQTNLVGLLLTHRQFLGSLRQFVSFAVLGFLGDGCSLGRGVPLLLECLK